MAGLSPRPTYTPWLPTPRTSRRRNPVLFHTLEFALLFLAVYPLHLVLRGAPRRALLLLASYAFYAWFSVPFIGLMLFSTVLDWGVARRMAATDDDRARRRWLAVSLIGNLGSLFVFKYTNWAGDSLNGIGTALFGVAPVPHFDILLPLGISFYTFQTLSFTVDVYRRQIRELPDLLTFALYVTFFPQLVAGPIVRASDLIPQLLRGPSFSERRLLDGIALFSYGLLKKVVVADRLAPVVNAVYADPAAYGPAACLIATYAFAFQIYADFSGYTDMARGIGLVFGYDLGINFRRPYAAAGIRDFWRRWHISLSTWLRDYLYISLGGNRGHSWMRLRNVLLTMLLGGLWHGASWNFVIWGGIHGVWIVLAQRFGRARLENEPLRSAGAVIRRVVITTLTFHGVLLTWVFFRAETLTDAAAILTSFTRSGLASDEPRIALMTIPLLLGADWVASRQATLERIARTPLLYWAAVVLAWMLVAAFGAFGSSEFIYFQF